MRQKKLPTIFKNRNLLTWNPVCAIFFSCFFCLFCFVFLGIGTLAKKKRHIWTLCLWVSCTEYRVESLQAEDKDIVADCDIKKDLTTNLDPQKSLLMFPTPNRLSSIARLPTKCNTLNFGQAYNNSYLVVHIYLYECLYAYQTSTYTKMNLRAISCFWVMARETFLFLFSQLSHFQYGFKCGIRKSSC